MRKFRFPPEWISPCAAWTCLPSLIQTSRPSTTCVRSSLTREAVPNLVITLPTLGMRLTEIGLWFYILSVFEHSSNFLGTNSMIQSWQSWILPIWWRRRPMFCSTREGPPRSVRSPRNTSDSHCLRKMSRFLRFEFSKVKLVSITQFNSRVGNESDSRISPVHFIWISRSPRIMFIDLILVNNSLLHFDGVAQQIQHVLVCRPHQQLRLPLRSWQSSSQ